MGRYDWEERGELRAKRLSGPSKAGSKSLIVLFGVFVLALGAGGFFLKQSADKNEAQSSSSPVQRPQTVSSPPEIGSRESSMTRETNVPAFVFRRCGAIRTNCVVDGDTIWLQGTKIRLVDIDAPEVHKPRCPLEAQLADQATDRLVSMLNEGPFSVARTGDRDEDVYGRKLRMLSRDGKSLGDNLVAEGLAHRWTGRKEPWC